MDSSNYRSVNSGIVKVAGYAPQKDSATASKRGRETAGLKRAEIRGIWCFCGGLLPALETHT